MCVFTKNSNLNKIITKIKASTASLLIENYVWLGNPFMYI